MAEQLHRKRKKRWRGPFGLVVFVFLPAVAAMLYALLVYTPIYSSRTTIMIRSGTPGVQANGLLNLLTGGGGREQEIVLNYLKSRDLLLRLAQKYDLEERYGSPKIDPYNRFRWKGSKDRLVDYLRSLIAIELDSKTGAIHVHALSFEPELARQLLTDMIAEARKYVLGINQKLIDHQIVVMRQQLENAKKAMDEALQALYRFRQQHEVVSTEKEFGLRSQAFSKLLERKVLLELELNNKAKVLQQNSPTIKRLRSELASVNRQIEVEKRRIFAGGRKSLNDIDMRYRILQNRLEIARKVYEIIKKAYENINIKKGLEITQIITIESPSMPDYPRYPRPFRLFLIVFLAALSLYYILRLIYRIIVEHR